MTTAGHPLKFIRQSSLSIEAGYRYTDIAAGSFSGDGRDELALANAADLHVLTVDDDWNITEHKTAKMSVGASIVPWAPVKIVPGLFRFDPASGFHLNRSQLALCYFTGKGCTIHCRAIQVENTEGVYTTSAASTCTLDNVAGGMPDVALRGSMEITSGNFIGHGTHGKATSPLEQVALFWNHLDTFGSHHIDSVQNPELWVMNFNTCEAKEFWWGYEHTWTYNEPSAYILTVSAADIDGDSYLLGVPAHIVVDDLVTMDYVIQEPPKHVDYLPLDPQNRDGDWDVFNISGDSQFYVEFKDAREVMFETSATNTSSWAIGGSTSLDLQESITVGNMDVDAMRLSIETETKLGYDYNYASSSWNSHYESRKVSFSSQTNRDDFIAGKIQLMDVWRFPIIGYKNPDPDKPPHGVMDIVLPGPALTFQSDGKAHADWYQPKHQNRNILSYPPYNKPDFPPDLGSFKVPGQKDPVHDTMNELLSYAYGGISQRLDISWTDKAGSGSEKQYSHTLGESTDLTTGFKAKCTDPEPPLVTFKIKGSFGMNLHNENSWGGKHSATCINSESEGITINVPASSSPNHAYAFKPAVYVSSGSGALKVIHATDPLGSTEGELWWRSQYGGLPDPALNLPNRFVWHQPEGSHRIEYWTLNEDDTRMEMRGFLMRKGEVNPISGLHELLGGPPVDGDQVLLCARGLQFRPFP